MSRLTVAVQITMATLVVFIDALVFGEFSARQLELCSMSLHCDLYPEGLKLKVSKSFTDSGFLMVWSVVPCVTC